MTMDLRNQSLVKVLPDADDLSGLRSNSSNSSNQGHGAQHQLHGASNTGLSSHSDQGHNSGLSGASSIPSGPVPSAPPAPPAPSAPPAPPVPSAPAPAPPLVSSTQFNQLQQGGSNQQGLGLGGFGQSTGGLGGNGALGNNQGYMNQQGMQVGMGSGMVQGGVQGYMSQQGMQPGMGSGMHPNLAPGGPVMGGMSGMGGMGGPPAGMPPGMVSGGFNSGAFYGQNEHFGMASGANNDWVLMDRNAAAASGYPGATQQRPPTTVTVNTNTPAYGAYGAPQYGTGSQAFTSQQMYGAQGYGYGSQQGQGQQGYTSYRAESYQSSMHGGPPPSYGQHSSSHGSLSSSQMLFTTNQATGQVQPHWITNVVKPQAKDEVEILREWFMAVDQDRSGSISCEELGSALEASGERFNRLTVKMMIDMFDRNQNGTIDFLEFSYLFGYIKKMRSSFESFDVHHSGMLDVNEINQALLQAGYRFGYPQTLLILCDKFDKKRFGRLSFENFLELGVYLGSMRTVFQKHGWPTEGYNGSVSPQFESFIVQELSKLC